ncbi:MAG: aminopeptidase [Planctomycetes bacterium]|nr:aminopeptidase [Planctomycetota bacterium]
MKIRVVTGVLLALLLVSAVATAQSDGPQKTPDGRFTIESEVPRLGVISQDNTGTCWSFGTMSFLESEVTRITGMSVDLSEMYPVHFAYVEKAKRFIDAKGENTFGEGGLCHDVIDVIKKYGITPNDDFTGLCNGAKRHNHGEMASLLKGMSQQLAKARRRSPVWEKAYSAVIETYLGELPKTVAVGDAQLTPVEYARDYLKLPLEDYVEVMSFATEPFWTTAALKVPDNWMHYDQYLNIPVNDMMAAFDHAIGKGYSLAVDMDVSEAGFQAGAGKAKLDDALEKSVITDELRKEHFESGKTSDDHLMHIVGVAKDDEGGTWYMTKNSWGTVGPYKGYLLMSRQYVALKMLSFMVHKDGLPSELRGKLGR